MWRRFLAMDHRPIRILLIGSNLWYIGEGMFGPLLGIYSEQIGGNVLDLTWAWSIYLFISGFCTLGIGALSDRWRSPGHLMVAGYALNALCTFAYLLVRLLCICCWCRPRWASPAPWRTRPGMCCMPPTRRRSELDRSGALPTANPI